MENLANLLVKGIEHWDEKNREKIKTELDLLGAEYINQSGEIAREELKKRVSESNKNERFEWLRTNVDEKHINKAIEHVANGHATMVSDLIWADLVHEDQEYFQANRDSSALCRHILGAFGFIQIDQQNNILYFSETPNKISEHIGKALSSTSHRVICPYCYRIIREWKITENYFHFAPAKVKCKNCGNIVPTPFTPWNKRSQKYKLNIFIFPTVLIVAGLIATIASKEAIILFFGVGGILGGLYMIIQEWREGQESLKTPTW